MAGKNRGNDNSGGGQSTNRFRFVMIEGELSESTMSAFAHAITTALKPATPAAPASRVQGHAAPALSAGNGDGAAAELDGEEVAIVENSDDPAPAPSERERRSQPRRPVKREILKNVDLTAGDVPFEDFMKAKGSPTETSRRFMVIAAWFNKYGGATEITVDHVYTAYRGIGLTLDVKDVGQVFRDLKGQGWGDYKDRKFEINPIGLGVVNKMTNEGLATPP